MGHIWVIMIGELGERIIMFSVTNFFLKCFLYTPHFLVDSEYLKTIRKPTNYESLPGKKHQDIESTVNCHNPEKSTTGSKKNAQNMLCSFCDAQNPKDQP